MHKITRRELNKLLLGSAATVAGGALPLLANSAQKSKPKSPSSFGGVLIGVQTYSFRDMPLDRAIEAMADIGITSCELWTGNLETEAIKDQYRKGEWDTPKTREMQAQWRKSVSANDLSNLRAKFNRAGVDVHALNYSIRDHFTDEEIDLGFKWARSLGAKVMTSSSNVSTAKRIDKYARKHRMMVGMHNHSDLKNPNEFATPDSFKRAMQGASKYIAINLDIGHFVAANFDPVPFIKQHHDRIVAFHIKDRKRDQGANVPFGQGDTPIREVLTLLRERRTRVPANIEFEYEGANTVEEVRKCFNYCKEILTA
jgi:sugar phosphate isomerase/epimerase